MMPANFAISDWMNLPNWAGESGAVSAPSRASLALTSVSVSARAISALSLATMSGGVAAGTSTPNQVLISKSRTPDSATVGTSGVAGERFAVDTAIARSLPALTCGIAGGMPEKNITTCPPSRSVNAGAAPLYGTWVIVIPALRCKSSNARCAGLPLPAEA